MAWIHAGRLPWRRLATSLVAGFLLVTALPAGAAGTWTVESGAAVGSRILSGVSCLPTGWCAAVGTRYDQNAQPKVFAKSGNGSAWTVAKVSSPKESWLQSVSCVASNWCQAVGWWENARRPLNEHWNGKAWAPLPSPTARGTLSGVSCTSRSFCMAVGAFAERWNGKKWSVVPTPRRGAGTSFESVACESWKWCVAVGSYFIKGPQRDYVHTLAEIWNGKVWRIVPTPTPTGRAELVGVDCVSTTWCTAIGNGLTATPIEHWDGHAWTVMGHPLASAKDAAMRGVSCASPSTCVVVGDGPLSELWDGTAWTQMGDPVGELPPTFFLGVSCFAAMRCKAVGEGTTVSVTG